MTLLRQFFLVAILGLVALAAAVRFYPPARAVVASFGLPQAWVDIVSGSAMGEVEATGPGGGAGGGARATVVTTAPATFAQVSDRIEAIGSGEALRTVAIVPLVAGVLSEVAVVSGQVVRAGDLLARLEADSAEIAKAQADLALQSAEDRLARYRRLSEGSAVSQVQVDELRTERDAAELDVREAAVALRDRSILAPIDGIVGIVPVELGDYVTPGTEIAVIDDRSRITVDFWIPERFSGDVAIGQQVSAGALAYAGEVFEGEITALGSRIDPASRTLQVRATLDNPQDRLRPGMSFAVTLDFEGETYPAVDPLAVQWDKDGSYIWQVVEDRAVRTPVRIVQRDPDRVLVDGDIPEGAPVVIQGLLGLRDGAAIRMTGGAEPAPAASGEVATREGADRAATEAGDQG